jgi:Outer membrane protein and related peptidoglycan-associated (lipo)proteins
LYKSKEVSANIGLINQFRLGKAIDLNVDVMGTLVNDRFDGETGGRTKEGILSATIGIVYKFNERKWYRRQDKTVYDMTEANKLRSSLEKANAENRRLQEEVNANIKTEKVIENRVIASPNYVIFKINSIYLSKESRVSLGLFAETIKKGDSTSVYIISGYADAATGTKKINERLSRGRAEAVYNCLINEYGISPKQLEVDYKGGVENMFYDEPYLSRAVITRVR